jgi:hypothetical protein
VQSCHVVHARPGESDQADPIFEYADASLMLTRMDHICGSRNNRNWSQAESYLTRHLSMVKDDHEVARRVRHLLYSESAQATEVNGHEH